MLVSQLKSARNTDEEMLTGQKVKLCDFCCFSKHSKIRVIHIVRSQSPLLVVEWASDDSEIEASSECT